MNILLIGGTIFLGRFIAEEALRRGHTLTLFHRGKHNPQIFPEAEKLHGDRRADVSALRGRSWDAVIDTCGYMRRDIRTIGNVLRNATEHYTFISSVSVYADFSPRDIAEAEPVGTIEDPNTEEVTGEAYGPLKAICEHTAEEYFPNRTCIVRPGLIVGPYDPTNRFSYWLQRVAHGGDILAPGTPEEPVQFIDVRDLAAWVVLMAEHKHTGIFNATGPHNTLSMEQFLHTCARTLQAKSRFVWVDEEFVLNNNITPFTELPLWVPKSSSGIHRVNCSKAIEAGLQYRPTEETIRDTFAWEQAHTELLEHRMYKPLSTQREAEVLAAWHDFVASNPNAV